MALIPVEQGIEKVEFTNETTDQYGRLSLSEDDSYLIVSAGITSYGGLGAFPVLGNNRKWKIYVANILQNPMTAYASQTVSGVYYRQKV